MNETLLISPRHEVAILNAANGRSRRNSAIGVSDLVSGPAILRGEVGDLLEAKVEAGKITFTPKSVVDRGVAESLADFASGRSFGPFKTNRELIDSLHKESAKVRSKTKANRKPRK